MSGNISDAELIAAVEAAAERGDMDLWEGGVAAGTVADDIGRSKHTVKRRLRLLADAGDLVQVWGGVPDDGRPRRSYLPPGHPYTIPEHERGDDLVHKS